MGDQLFLADELVAGLLVGFVAVTVAEIGQADLQGVEHGMVVVQGKRRGPENLKGFGRNGCCCPCLSL